MNQPTNQPTNQTNKQTNKQSINQSINLSSDFLLVARIPSVREPLSSRPEVESFREAYLMGSLGLPWRRKVRPEGPFWGSRGSILGFQGVHFGRPRGACKESAPTKAQPSILGPFGGHFGVLFGASGKAFLRGRLSVFLCFCRKGVH